MRTRSKASVAFTLALAAACGGQEPPPKPPAAEAAPRDPAWLPRVAETCARIASCTHAHDVPHLRSPAACVDWWVDHGDPASPDPLQRCLADAKTCDAITTCMHGGGDARAAQFCAQRPGVVSGCDGERLVSCSDDDAKESTVIDCNTLGASCKEMRAAGGLVIRGCVNAQKCPAGAPEARCDGRDAVLGCHDGVMERSICKRGTQCEQHPDANGEATASCEIPGRRCGALGARRCDGDRLVECSEGGRVHVSDCEGLGLRCAGSALRAGCYVPANVECDKDTLPKCEGGALVFCAAGRVQKIACASIGMGACDPAARGPVAACSAEAGPRASAP